MPLSNKTITKEEGDRRGKKEEEEEEEGKKKQTFLGDKDFQIPANSPVISMNYHLLQKR